MKLILDVKEVDRVVKDGVTVARYRRNEGPASKDSTGTIVGDLVVMYGPQQEFSGDSYTLEVTVENAAEVKAGLREEETPVLDLSSEAFF